MDSFFILYKMTFKVFENLKFLQNLGMTLHDVPIHMWVLVLGRILPMNDRIVLVRIVNPF